MRKFVIGRILDDDRGAGYSHLSDTGKEGGIEQRFHVEHGIEMAGNFENGIKIEYFPAQSLIDVGEGANMACGRKLLEPSLSTIGSGLFS